MTVACSLALMALCVSFILVWYAQKMRSIKESVPWVSARQLRPTIVTPVTATLVPPGHSFSGLLDYAHLAQQGHVIDSSGSQDVFVDVPQGAEDTTAILAITTPTSEWANQRVTITSSVPLMLVTQAGRLLQFARNSVGVPVVAIFNPTSRRFEWRAPDAALLAAPSVIPT